MADRKLTLFEIHLHDATFRASSTNGAEALPTDETDEAVDDETVYDEAGGSCAGKGAVKAFLVVAVLAVVALAAKRLLGGDLDEELSDLADLDEA